jgi:IS5 family transposase
LPVSQNNQAIFVNSSLGLFISFFEEHKLQEKLFNEINAELIRQGYLLERVRIVDAISIKAPSSIKNKAHSRVPEMSSTKKGNNCYFGMKMHIGIDTEGGLFIV